MNHARFVLKPGPALLLAGLFGLVGCVSIGHPFLAGGGQAPAIRIGKTNQAEILKTYGQPQRQGVEDGDPTWTYLHYHLGVFSGVNGEDLYIRFNADGTVHSYTFNKDSGQ